MIKITLQIDGMMCSMCESHVNDAIRRSFKVKKVTSSHAKGRTEILTESDIPDELLAKALGEMGYQLLSSQREPYEKKGFLASLFGR